MAFIHSKDYEHIFRVSEYGKDYIASDINAKNMTKRVSDYYEFINRPLKVDSEHVLAPARNNGKWGLIYVPGRKGDVIILPFIFDDAIMTNSSFAFHFGKNYALFTFKEHRHSFSLLDVKRELQKQKPKMIKQFFETG